MGGDRHARSGWRAGFLAGTLLVGAGLMPGPVTAREPSGRELRADLDGKPMALVDVGRSYCHDFDYPVIHCFSTPIALEAAVESTAALAGVDYVTIYEFSTYQGAYMYLSEDSWALSGIGWNDRISSFVVRNGQSGAFWTDWLYSGTKYNFCCNSQVPALGGYDNTFSSVYRN
jgi:hypothetical protein